MKVVINKEHIKIILLRGGYRSWTMSYSDGLQFQPDGSLKSLWRRPRFHHVDMRKLDDWGAFK